MKSLSVHSPKNSAKHSSGSSNDGAQNDPPTLGLNVGPSRSALPREGTGNKFGVSMAIEVEQMEAEEETKLQAAPAQRGSSKNLTGGGLNIMKKNSSTSNLS